MVARQRTCIGCRQVRAKEDLIRIVRSSVDGLFVADPGGKEKGRGAYICPNADCVNKAMQLQGLSRAFRIAPGSVDHVSVETIDKLKENLLGLVEGRYH